MNSLVQTVSQKQKINQILDIEPAGNLNDNHKRVVYVLKKTKSNGEPTAMTTNDVYELKQIRPVGYRRSKVDTDHDFSVEKSIFKQKDLIHIDLKDGDSLQKLALMFNCKVAEIKQANKIYTEQDLYALKVIKIPVIRGSSISPVLEKRNIIDASSAASNQEDFDTSYAYISENDNEIPDGYGCLVDCEPEAMSMSRKMKDELGTDIKRYLNTMDLKIEKSYAEMDSRIDNLDEATSSLDTHVRIPAAQKLRPETLGSACSCTWWQCFLCFCFIAVVCPIAIFLFYYFVSKGP